MIKVPFTNLTAAYGELKTEIDAAVAHVLQSGWYIGGSEVSAFEEAFADYCGARHCVGVGNGLDALQLAMEAMDVGPGDEVIVASNSFIATLLAVSRVGATPVLVEPDPQTFNLDPARVSEAITDRTKVILPTHLYGQPADLDPLLELARQHGLRLLEDAAQAHGARYKGQRVGAHGDAVAWSFYPTKNLGAMGDSGAVTTSNPEIAKRVRQRGNYGSTRRYVNEVKGVNSRMDPLQAAILAVKLGYLDEWNDRRRAIAGFYVDQLAGCGLGLPIVPNWADPVWHLFVVQASDRDGLASTLEADGVETLIHYPIPPHLQLAYSDLAVPGDGFPVAVRLANRVLSLPIGPHLTEENAARVVASIREFSSQARLAG